MKSLQGPWPYWRQVRNFDLQPDAPSLAKASEFWNRFITPIECWVLFAPHNIYLFTTKLSAFTLWFSIEDSSMITKFQVNDFDYFKRLCLFLHSQRHKNVEIEPLYPIEIILSSNQTKYCEPKCVACRRTRNRSFFSTRSEPHRSGTKYRTRRKIKCRAQWHYYTYFSVFNAWSKWEIIENDSSHLLIAMDFIFITLRRAHCHLLGRLSILFLVHNLNREYISSRGFVFRPKGVNR